jgi:CTP:molybdopterin cytidylyltransferase MocA
MTSLHAWVLAAGQGQRLGGRTKAALHIDGRSLLARLLEALRQGAQPATLGVVCGRDRAAWETLQRELHASAHTPVPTLHHPDHALPTLGHSRQWALHRHLGPPLGPPLRSAAGHAPSPETSPASSQTPDLLLCVADLPRLQAADVAALCRAWRADPQRPFDALRPVVDGRPGHPVLLSARAVRVLAAAPPETGLREALQAAGLRLSLLALDSPGPVTDLDTPDDLQALRAAWPQADIRWPDDGFPPCAP